MLVKALASSCCSQCTRVSAVLLIVVASYSPLQIYGSQFFHVEPQMSADLPDEVFLAVNPRGVLIINPETKDVLSEYPYSEVRHGWCAALGASTCHCLLRVL